MRLALRGAVSVVTVAVALASAGCGTKSSENTPTGPQLPATNTARGRQPTSQQPPAVNSGGRVTSMAVAPPLGTAGSFAVLGAQTVTNTGPSVLNGDLGVSPGAAITGFPPGIVNGTIHAADAVALQAQTDTTTAYNALAGQACNQDLTGQNLGGLTLIPGAYCFSSSAFLTGTLTLDGQGNAGAVWVFQIGSTLVTASGSNVAFINSGQACGAFWQVGSSATLGTGSTLRGNVLALTSITATTGARSFGALLARNGAVTLDTNQVNVVGSCGGVGGPVGVPALPRGAGLTLLVVILSIGAYVLSRH
jgi:ice-binding like protein